MTKRVFLIVLDSFGIGEAPDAKNFGDENSNTLASIFADENFNAPTLYSLGLFNIDGVTVGQKNPKPLGNYGRLMELSQGKDTVSGHWEIAGVVSTQPFPTYPNGFSDEILQKLTDATGRNILCNKPYSGTEVILDYGRQHQQTGDLIVYTSADSVMQIACHEEIVPIDELYDICKKARGIMTGKDAIGRIIARPFIGEYPDYKRTANRHDYALAPPQKTLLDFVKDNGLDCIGIGKTGDIFCNKGLTESHPTKSNADGMQKIVEISKRDFKGLCFTNLVDFDSQYGHRNDVKGYAKAISEFDEWLKDFLPQLNDDDVLILTADHGCDPATPSTDHSREYVPLLVYGKNITQSQNYGTKTGFTFICDEIMKLLNIKPTK